jgi:hypothetical protein
MLLANPSGQSIGVINGLGFMRGQMRGHGIGLSGSSENQALQTALTNLATATNRPQINPGKVDGVIGTQTVMAVLAATDLMAEKLPEKYFLALKGLQAGFAVSKTVTAEMKKYVETAAVPLTIAANTAAVKFKANPALVVAPCTGFFCPGWYKTVPGILLIAGVALVGYKLLTK